MGICNIRRIINYHKSNLNFIFLRISLHVNKNLYQSSEEDDEHHNPHSYTGNVCQDSGDSGDLTESGTLNGDDRRGNRGPCLGEGETKDTGDGAWYEIPMDRRREGHYENLYTLM